MNPLFEHGEYRMDFLPLRRERDMDDCVLFFKETRFDFLQINDIARTHDQPVIFE